MLTKDEIDAAPKVTLGKKEWAMPELAGRQIQKIVPRIFRGFKVVSLMAAQKADEVTDDDLGVLYDIAYIALTRAHPELTRDEFDDLPVTISELMNAIVVIGEAAGLEVRKVQPEGEALAAETPPQTPPALTGTQSSPTLPSQPDGPGITS
jgi:hypothetical protein